MPVVSSAPVTSGSTISQYLVIEARLKYPETRTRVQELTVWVSRDGVPVPNAVVTVIVEDEPDEPIRVLDPTNANGRTIREFTIGHDKKGTIGLTIQAIAPDGSTGRTSTTYFRR